MKLIKKFILVLSVFSFSVYSQHLPLAVGNEWHYVQGLGPVGANIGANIATAVDTITINGKVYIKIERKGIPNPIFDVITFDRIEGDSLYYRIYGDDEELIFNFNWSSGQIISTPSSSDSNCVNLKSIYQDTVTAFGISTFRYQVFFGFWCLGMSDTGWTLSSYQYLKYFGAMDASDGRLIGAKINGIVYGNLHPIPVELLSFSKEIVINSVRLSWKTATETNNYGFEILRKVPSGSDTSTKVGFVKGKGTTTEVNDYEFWDKNLRQGEYTYQLIQIDYDGTRKQIAEIAAMVPTPISYALDQNYPNPFNPVTNIVFSIPQRSKVELNIFNALGQKVSTILNEEKEAGSYKVTFNAASLPSGVYFYRISAGEFTQTKKLVLLK